MVRAIGALIVGSLFLMGSNPATQLIPERLLSAVQSIHVQPSAYVVHHSGRTSESLTPSQAAQNMRQWARELSLSNLEKNIDQDGIRYDASGIWGKNVKVSFHMIIDHPDAMKSNPYLAIQATVHGKQSKDWKKAAERIQAFLHKQHIPEHLHYSIQGNLATNVTLMATSKTLMRYLNAREVEGMQTDQTISISAFSPVLSETIQTRGGAMNLQIAAHRDERSKQLIVTIGSPIITIEY